MLFVVIMGHRDWCFTLATPSDEEIENLNVLRCRYMVYQWEKSNETGLVHIQGYVQFGMPIRREAIKDDLSNDRIHLERRLRTKHAARAYCFKEDTRIPDTVRFEKGIFITQGYRSDMELLQENVRSGVSTFGLFEEHFGLMVRYPNGIWRARLAYSSRRTWKTVVTVFYGPPGSGKTRRAFQLAPDAYWLTCSNYGNTWFDGYDSHEDVIIDDFYGWIRWSILLQMCDRYPLRVDVRGGSVEFVAKRIFITSNSHPEEWYHNVRTPGALMRRIDSVQFIDL